MRSLIAELSIDLADLPEMLSYFEEVEGETAVCAAGPFGNYQVRQAITGDVMSDRDQFRIGVVFVNRPDDESSAILSSFKTIDSSRPFEDFEIGVVRVGCRI